MSTIENVIDRIYRDYLTPPGEQGSRFKVGVGGIDASATTLPVDLSWMSPEEQDIIGPGSLIEVESELLLVEATSGGPPPTSLTVRRGMFGTTAAAHAADTEAFVAGDNHVPRQRVFEAIQDTVESLWPDLYTIDVEETYGDGTPVELPANVGEIIDVLASNNGRWTRVASWNELQDFPHSSTGVAVQTTPHAGTAALHVYYKKKPARPTATTDTFAALGLEESWLRIIQAGAVGQVIANEDVDQTTVNFITESLAAQGFRVGEGADIRNSLLQYQDFLIRPLKRALRVRNRGRVLVDRSY